MNNFWKYFKKFLCYNTNVSFFLIFIICSIKSISVQR